MPKDITCPNPFCYKNIKLSNLNADEMFLTEEGINIICSECGDIFIFNVSYSQFT